MHAASGDCPRLTDLSLRTALAAKFGVDQEDVALVRCVIKDGSKKGENFGSEIKTVTVEATVKKSEKHTVSFMAKCMPMNKVREKGLRDCLAFEKEVRTYTEILRQLRLDERSMLERINVPEVYYSHAEDGIIVMENLKMSGFSVLDKTKGLDLPACRKVLRQLALFHAYTFHFIEKFGTDAFKEHHPEFIHDRWWPPSETGDYVDVMYSEMYQVMASITEEFSDDADLSRRVAAIGEAEFLRRIHAVTPPSEEGFNCLIHGDAWVNNFLFSADGDIRILDFQLVRRARPTVDLAYFLASSLIPETRRRHLDNLLSDYYRTLADSLNSLGYDAGELYPYTSLKTDFKECYIFGIVSGLMHAQLNLSGEKAIRESGLLSTETRSEEDALKIMEQQRKEQLLENRQNVALRKRILDITREADEYGYFD